VLSIAFVFRIPGLYPLFSNPNLKTQPVQGTNNKQNIAEGEPRIKKRPKRSGGQHQICEPQQKN